MRLDERVHTCYRSAQMRVATVDHSRYTVTHQTHVEQIRPKTPSRKTPIYVLIMARQ